MNLYQKSEIYRKFALALLIMALCFFLFGVLVEPQNGTYVIPVVVGYMSGSILGIKARRMREQYAKSFGHDEEEYY